MPWKRFIQFPNMRFLDQSYKVLTLDIKGSGFRHDNLVAEVCSR